MDKMMTHQLQYRHRCSAAQPSEPVFVLRDSKDRGMLCVFYIYRGRRRGIRHQVTFPKGREGVLDTNYVWKRVALLSQVFCQHSSQLKMENVRSFCETKICTN